MMERVGQEKDVDIFMNSVQSDENVHGSRSTVPRHLIS